MLRLFRLRHAGPGCRVGAVRTQPGASRALERQAKAGPWKLPPSWGLMTAQATRASHDLPRPQSGRSAKLAQAQTDGFQGFTQYDTALQRLTGVEGEGLNKQELHHMVHSPALGAFQASHVTAWLERCIALDDELLCPPKDMARVLSSEGLLVMGRAREILEGQRATTPVRRARSGGGLMQDEGVESFTPSLASRVVYALGRGGYLWEGSGREELDRLVSLLLPVAVGEGGKGLRKLTAQELARLTRGTAILDLRQVAHGVGPGTGSPEAHFSDEMVRVEAECLRRGLDKFKAGDLADLLGGFAKADHAVSKELMEAVRERIMRRGYLTSGRGGQTDPRDVLRLLSPLCKRPFKVEPGFVSSLISEVLATKGVVDSWQPRELLYAIRICPSEDGEARCRMLKRLVAREEEWAGRNGMDRQAIQHFYTLVNEVQFGACLQEAVDLLGRLTVKWAAEVEAGECVLHTPLDYFFRLLKCVQRGGLDGKDKTHAARVLARGFADRIHLDAYSSCLSSGHLVEMLKVFRRLRFYPGHDVLGGFIDRFHVLTSVGLIEPSNLNALNEAVVWAMEEHGYTPPPGFPTTVFQWCSKVRLTHLVDVLNVAKTVERLYGSILPKAPRKAYPSQAVVDALLHHIGDPAKLIECLAQGDTAPLVLARLEAAVRRLKRNKAMAPSAPHQDGHKEGEQADGAGLGRGGRDDKAMAKALWTRVKGAQMRQGPDHSLDQPSRVTRALSTAEVAMLLKGLAYGDFYTMAKGKDAAGIACTRAMVREGIRPRRLKAMDGGTLRAWLRCLGPVGRKLELLDMQERRAMLDAWEEEVSRRGLPQVATKPGELADLMCSLRHVRVEVSKELVWSLLVGMERMGLHNFTPAEIRSVFPSRDALAWMSKYREYFVATLQATPPQGLDRSGLLAILWGLDTESLGASDAYLSQLMAALEAKGVYELPLQHLAAGVCHLNQDLAPGAQPLLRALERAVSHGHPGGILAPLPEDEGERDALRAQALQGLSLGVLCDILRAFSMAGEQCDFSGQERVLRAYLSVVEQGLDPTSVSSRALKEAGGGKGVVARPPSRGGHVGPSRADEMKALLEWWTALLWCPRDDTSGLLSKQPAGQAMHPGDISLERLRDLEPVLPYLASLAFQSGLSHQQMGEAWGPLLDYLDTSLERGPGKSRRGVSTNLRMHRAVLLFSCLEHASVVVRRRETMVTLWEWGVSSGFRYMDGTAAVALVRGAAAHDLHPGTEALRKFVSHFTERGAGARTAAVAVEMEQRAAEGGEGAGGGAEGRRFLRELRKLLEGGREA